MQPRKDPLNFTLICLEWADGGCPLQSYQMLEEPVQDGQGRWLWFDGQAEVSEAGDTQAWICIPELRLADRALQTFVREDAMQVFHQKSAVKVTALALNERGALQHPQPRKLYNFLKGLVDGKEDSL